MVRRIEGARSRSRATESSALAMKRGGEGVVSAWAPGRAASPPPSRALPPLNCLEDLEAARRLDAFRSQPTVFKLLPSERGAAHGAASSSVLTADSWQGCGLSVHCWSPAA